MLFNTILTKCIPKIGKNIVFRVYPLISRSATSSNIETVDLGYSVYDSCGKTSTKPPLIILHGLLGSKKDVDGISKAINQATGRRIITIDARNHGDSPHSPRNTYLHMAHDVIELLKNMELPKVSLCGYSMGGHTAMVLALIRPDLVSSLVVEDMSPIKTSDRALPIAKMFEGMATTRIRSDISMSKAIELAHEHLKTVSDDVTVRNYLIENLVNSNTGFYTWKCNVPVLKEAYLTDILNFPTNLKDFQYAGPTLFIGGSLSNFIRKSDFPQIKKYFPSAELTYVDGAGHWVHFQKPEKFLEVLGKFLTEK